MKKKIWKKILAGILSIALLFNSANPLLLLSYAQEATPSAELIEPSPQPSPTSEPSPTPSVEPSPSPTPTPFLDEILTALPSTQSAAVDTKNESSATLAPPLWQTHEDGSVTTTYSVVLNQTYKAPQNDKVTVTFTKLPETSGTVTIKEVNALGVAAYDITSTMTDGTFEYVLTLPTSTTKNVEVKASEDGETFVTLGGVTAQTDTVTITGLNHFTVFVVTGTIDETLTETEPGVWVRTLAANFVPGSGDVVINEFVFDPSLNNEWIELYNTGSLPVDLTGWKLKDGNNINDDLTLSGTIPANGILVFESNASGWLNNLSNRNGDTISLTNSDGTVIYSQVTYQQETTGTVVNGNVSSFGNMNQGQSIGRIVNEGGISWQAYSVPTKGWFNDAGELDKAPLLSDIDSQLNDQGITSNIGEFDNPSNTPSGDSGLYFEKTDEGKIIFTTSLNLTNQNTVSILQELGDKMELTDGHLKFDSTTANNMAATGAKLFMYGLDEFTTTPNIIVKDDDGTIIDGSDIISNINFSGGTLTFDASHFTQFDVENLNIYADSLANPEMQDGSLEFPFGSIQEAIDAAPENGTVHVAAGTYNESLTIDKSLSLEGPGIDAEQKATITTDCEDVLTITSSNVTVKGLYFSQGNEEEGYSQCKPVIRVNGATNVTITGNDIAGGNRGVGLRYDSSGNTISKNVIHDNNTGIKIASSKNNNVSENNIYENGVGILLDVGDSKGEGDGDISDNTITKNNIHDNTSYGISARKGISFTELTISQNDITGNNIEVRSKEITLDLSKNYWGTAVLSSIQSKIEGDVSYAPYYVNQAKTILSSTSPTNVYVNGDYSVESAGDHFYNYDAFSTIQPAIDAVASGGTVNIAAGTIGGGVTINKNLTLIGAGNSTILQLDGETVITVTTGTVNISKIKISGAYTALSVNGGNVTISDSEISGNTNGVTAGDGVTLVTAIKNYWGSSSGPSHSTNSGATGNSISDRVSYRSFYTDEARTTLSTSKIAPADLSSLLTLGSFSIPSGSTNTSTPRVNVNEALTLNVSVTGGTHSVNLPSDTVITKTDGTNLDASKLTSSDVSASSLTGLGSGVVAAGALQWGIPNTGLTFSTPITLNIFVGTALNGQTLDVLRSVDGVTWTSDGIVDPKTCTVGAVTSGICTFKATKASTYATTHATTTASTSSSSSSGGGGGGDGLSDGLGCASHDCSGGNPAPQSQVSGAITQLAAASGFAEGVLGSSATTDENVEGESNEEVKGETTTSAQEVSSPIPQPQTTSEQSPFNIKIIALIVILMLGGFGIFRFFVK